MAPVPERTRFIPLATVWCRLLEGRARLASHAIDAEHYRLVLESNEVPRPTTEPAARLLRALVLGVPQKVMAIEHQMSEAAIAVRLRSAVETLGFRGKAGALPPAIVLAGLASSVADQSPLVEASSTSERHEVIHVPRLAAPPCLTRSEGLVFHFVVAGLARAQIARARGTSPRTVANQVSTIFRKLGASNRLGAIRAVWEKQSELVAIMRRSA